MTAFEWIHTQHDAHRKAGFTAEGLAGLTHQSVAEATQAIKHALIDHLITPCYLWICPQCGTTLAITFTIVPSTLSFCDRCGFDFNDSLIEFPDPLPYFQILTPTPWSTLPA